MSTFTTDALRSEGFTGFVRFSALAEANVPETLGVYVVLRQGEDEPVFLTNNPGGRFKGKDPTVEPAVLCRRWVTGCQVIYIGKANNLRRRLRQFHDFGRGRPIGHWGGRYIWQVQGSADFRVAWTARVGEPRMKRGPVRCRQPVHEAREPATDGEEAGPGSSSARVSR